jgi:hypothetical protein
MSGGQGGEKGLRELLARLRERLSHSRLDADSRKHLSAVMSDIEGGGAAGAHAPKLESLAVRFEADHPGLAEVIREVIDALVRGGV